MFNLKLVQTGVEPVFSQSDILSHYREKAGPLVVESIREVLGNEAELGYDISDEYAIRKERDPRLRRIAGKSVNQPLILAGEIYEGLEVVELDDGFAVQVREGAGVSPQGFDYADYFNDEFKGGGLQYMGKGLDRVEEQFPGLLEDSIMETTGL